MDSTIGFRIQGLCKEGTKKETERTMIGNNKNQVTSGCGIPQAPPRLDCRPARLRVWCFGFRATVGLGLEP